MRPVDERTLEDFPIGSKWIDRSNSYTLVVVNHTDSHISFEVTESSNEYAMVGTTYKYLPTNTSWIIPFGEEIQEVQSFVCACPIRQLMINGCQCGTFQKEISNG